MLTPWGKSQHHHKITDGVYEVDTAGHGGVLVGTARATTLLSPQAIAKGWKWGSWVAYEEDCDWAIFAYEQPELYTAARNALPGYYQHRTAEEMKQIARGCLSRWHPDYLAQVEGGATRTESVDRQRRTGAKEEAMELLTPELRQLLPELYSQEHDADPLVICKFFTPDTQWSLYAIEFDGSDLFFGWIVGFEQELGYFSLAELEAARGPLGMPIERDLRFRPTRLSEVKKLHTA